MTGFKCKYCGKEYKTEKGLAKHHCVQMDRYNEWSDTMAYVFNIVNNYYQICKKCEDIEEQKIALINCRYYELIKKLEQWALATQPLSFISYVKYLKDNLINFKLWTNDHTYHCFLYQYLKNEPDAIAISRAENYFKNNDLTIDTISSNRLHLAIKYGSISAKYLKYINYPIEKIEQRLDKDQWQEIRPLLIDPLNFDKKY